MKNSRIQELKNLSLGWLVMAAALTFSACSSENDLVEETKTIEEPAAQTTKIHVTVGAGISDGEATTRSTVDYTGGTRTLQFTAGDRLYVWGQKDKIYDQLDNYYCEYVVAGTLELVAIDPEDPTKATFSGDLSVYRAEVQGEYAEGTDILMTLSGVTYPDGNLVSDLSAFLQSADPLGEFENVEATLIHEDAVKDVDYVISEDDRMVYYWPDCAATVEELMTTELWVSGLYDSGTKSFALAKDTDQPIVNCTISGLEAGVSYKVDYIYGATAAMSDHTKTLAASMTATAGTLAFAFIAETGDKFHGIRLTNTAEPTDTYDATIGQKAFASKVYNAARTAVGKKTPLTMEALEPGSIVVQSPKSGMKYKINNLAPVTLGTNDATFYVAKGDKVQFYGNGTSITKYLYTYITGGTATVKVYGNIMSLVDETGFATATTLDSDYAFTALFATNAKLTDASGLLLPATTLNTACYAQMFAGCTSLTAAPELPAETLASYCYQQMFINCRSLTTAPALDATTLTLQCYEEMFSGCTSLTTAPVLPAETLARRSYWRMFYGCTKLSAVKCLATNISATDCTSNWLSGVAATGTFTKASTMTTWPSGIDGIPDGWTVVDKQ